MKTYFIAKEDGYGQRTGNFEQVQLSEDQIEINHYGHKTYRGRFLYESFAEVLRAIQD